MSRVRVLNLPKNLTETDVRKFFSTKLPADAPPMEITDVCIKKDKKDASVSRMLFVGFKTAASGHFAVKYFNQSYFGSCKLHVELAAGLGEAPLSHKERMRERADRIEKRKREGAEKRSREESAGPGTPNEKGRTETAKDAFVKTRTETGGPSWASELMMPDSGAVGDESDAFKMQHARNVTKARTRQLKELESDAALEAKDEEAEEQKQEALATISDMDFLSSLGGPSPAGAAEETYEATDAVGAINAAVEESAEDAPLDEESSESICAASRRIRIGNIPYTTTEDDIRNYASTQAGPVESVHIPLTRDTKESKGAAFVTFCHPEDAIAALKTLSGGIFMGRLLRVSAAKLDPYSGIVPAQDDRDGGDTFKSKKMQAQRAADQKGLSWSSTYMTSNAAVQSMADRLKVDSSAIVSVDAGGAAVRAAVAEAVLTSEAKAILGDEGISFDVLSDSSSCLHKARSNTTILVKNLAPSQTKAENSMAELIKMFRRFGTLETIASPASRLFALFSFLYPQDARVAFQRLSYKNFNGLPLFLEWAPIGCLKDDDQLGPVEERVDSSPPANSTAYSIYCTNLPKGSGSETAFQDFLCEHCPKIARNFPRAVSGVRILADKGQAFISTSDEAVQSYIIAKINGKMFGGRPIVAAVSKSAPKLENVQEETKATSASTSNVPAGCDPLKVIVKNLPFEATEKDLREMFAAFSDVKSVRVPRKAHRFGAHRENNHRGFGFVEFLTEDEAASAIRTLSATHMYGRHLVLQYAKKGDTE